MIHLHLPWFTLLVMTTIIILDYFYCMSRPYPKLLLFITFLLLIGACATHNTSVLVVSKVDDIPDINKIYEKEIRQLKVGMNIHQVNSLFPNLERECYESGVCHFTVFQEQKIRLDERLGDLEILSGSLISLLALTCALSNDSCEKALAAAVNVGIATAVEYDRIRASGKSGGSSVGLMALVQMINLGTIGVEQQAQGQTVYRNSAPTGGILTLLQWINIEFDKGKVTKWAINKPLEQYQPKTFKNELPPLEDSL